MSDIIMANHIIGQTAKLVRPHFGAQEPNFRVITLQEPPKSDMLPYLDKEHRKQLSGQAPARCARVELVVKGLDGNNELFDLLVDLDHDKVIAKQHHKGKHSYIDADYMKQVEKACLANEQVQDEIRKLDLPKGASVVVEPWAYAPDGMNDMTTRVTMVWCPSPD
jgi:primary-amine oxidase